MSLNESILEDASPGWFGKQCRVARTLTPALSKRERGRCQPSLGLNPILPKTARATIKRYLTVRFLRRLNPFQKDVRMINEHIQNFFEEGELSPESVIRKFRITAADGKTYDAQPQRIDAEFEQAAKELKKLPRPTKPKPPET